MLGARPQRSRGPAPQPGPEAELGTGAGRLGTTSQSFFKRRLDCSFQAPFIVYMFSNPCFETPRCGAPCEDKPGNQHSGAARTGPFITFLQLQQRFRLIRTCRFVKPFHRESSTRAPPKAPPTTAGATQRAAGGPVGHQSSGTGHAGLHEIDQIFTFRTHSPWMFTQLQGISENPCG